MFKLFDEIKKVLESICNNNQVKKYYSSNNELLRSKVDEDARKHDPQLISALFNNQECKETFFEDISTNNGKITIFIKDKFCQVINNHSFLPDSFTAFENKIGLTVNGNYLSRNNDVVLSFPHKDCVLEGGQTKDDQKRDEVFYNEVLAQDEITTMLEPKCFANVKRYDKEHIDGETANEFKDDNLIIKGNNLIALSSILKRYEGKVKLIYIDPPYNTGSDSFKYNDSFNHSTWLVFMKNRLEIAKRLLSDDGAIYIQLDYHEIHYCKILMDEIFGENNFQREIIWRIGWLSGYKTNDNNWIRNHDSILFYSKNYSHLKFNKYYISRSEFKDIAKRNDKSKVERYPIEDVWNGNEYDDLNSIAIVSFSGETVSKMLNKDDVVKGQKSEKLIERIIKAHTDEGDLVLDFFGGTGTTASVSIKMKRKFIVCEQLDKHIDIMKRRLCKVIEGKDNSGISNVVNWKGGGSFVYCELAKFNQEWIEKIENASTDTEINDIYKNIQTINGIKVNLDCSVLEQERSDFEKLPIDDKKKVLISIIDKNTLYYNYSEIDDQNTKIADSDKSFTKSFYGDK